MNQPWLSRIPLYSLPRSYSQGVDYNPDVTLKEALHVLCGQYEAGQGGNNLAQQIASDIGNFQTLGLDKLSQTKRKQLIQTYSDFASPYAEEIIGWLSDKYAFDPACLTG